MGSAYLLGYNAGLCLAWGYVLYATLDVAVVKKGSTADVFQRTSLALKFAQTAAIMEVVHAVTGIVRSPVFITAMQVASRLWILWGIILLAPEPTTTSSLSLFTLHGIEFKLNLVTLLVAWATSEVIRYSFYAFKEALGYVPYPSLWLRYTGFIVLYPLGVASELTMVYLALPTIKTQGLLSYKMPNKINFGVDYAFICYLVCASYAPGLPTLYKYMLVQRKKVLGGGSKAGKQA